MPAGGIKKKEAQFCLQITLSAHADVADIEPTKFMAILNWS